MKLHRYTEERYPEYCLDKPSRLWGEANVDVPEELYERYKKALAEYNAVQLEISNLKGISDD